MASARWHAWRQLFEKRRRGRCGARVVAGAYASDPGRDQRFEEGDAARRARGEPPLRVATSRVQLPRLCDQLDFAGEVRAGRRAPKFSAYCTALDFVADAYQEVDGVSRRFRFDTEKVHDC